MASPPVVTTRPSASRKAAEWYSRGTVALAIVVQVSVAGFHNSAEKTAVVVLLWPGPDVPPVASTVPSGSKVALTWRRATLMDATARQAGAGTFKSITSANGTGGSPPPVTMILPGAYMTADA